MKKVMMVMILAFVSITVFAQRNDATPEERAERQTKQLTENLKLSDDQQKQVYILNVDRMKAMEEMRKSQTMDREKTKASQEKYQTELGKLLSDEQKEKLKTMMEERRGSGQGRGQGRGGNGPRN